VKKAETVTALPPAKAPYIRQRPKWRSRGWWLRQLHTWHWMSAALSLIGMLAFAITGLTLNHSASIHADPVVTHKTGTLDRPLLALLAKPAAKDAPLPAPVAARVQDLTGLDPAGRAAEWSDEEAYVAMPRPGGDGWVSVDRATGKVESEITDRGWISYLNDLHKGRNSGNVWFWFIDAFAAACIIFTMTGLILLQLHARHRPSTWPIVAAGLIVPFLLAFFFIH
jgi:hypothetical protein